MTVETTGSPKVNRLGYSQGWKVLGHLVGTRQSGGPRALEILGHFGLKRGIGVELLGICGQPQAVSPRL